MRKPHIVRFLAVAVPTAILLWFLEELIPALQLDWARIMIASYPMVFLGALFLLTIFAIDRTYMAYERQRAIESMREPLPDISLCEAVTRIRAKKGWKQSRVIEVHKHIVELAHLGHLHLWGKDRRIFHTARSPVPREDLNTAFFEVDLSRIDADQVEYNEEEAFYVLTNTTEDFGQPSIYFEHVYLNAAELERVISQ